MIGEWDATAVRWTDDFLSLSESNSSARGQCAAAVAEGSVTRPPATSRFSVRATISNEAVLRPKRTRVGKGVRRR